MDYYSKCAVGVFWGIEPWNVEPEDWTKEDVERAEIYCQEKMIDAIEYWS